MDGFSSSFFYAKVALFFVGCCFGFFFQNGHHTVYLVFDPAFFI